MSVFEQPLAHSGACIEPHKESSLLGTTDPHPVKLLNEFGKGEYILGCEYAGNLIPKKLETLRLTDFERSRHIAWDIGAGKLTKFLSNDLDSPAVLQRYSRLVYDCNRTMLHKGILYLTKSVMGTTSG